MYFFLKRGGEGAKGARGAGTSPNPAGGQRGFGGGAYDAEMTFTVFSKIYAVLSILWSKFLHKTRFSMTVKSMLVRPQGLRPGSPAPTYLPLLYH